MNLNKITNLPTPTTTTTNDAVPLNFLVNYVDLSNNQIIGGTKTFSNTVALNNGATCNSKNLSNVFDPINAQDAATKNYVDTQSANKNYVLRNGTLNMNGSLDMNLNKITNLSNPTTTTTNDAVPLSFLVNYVDLSNNQNIGGNKTFTNQVFFSGATKTNLDASDITNAVTMNTDQNITGTKSFSSTVALNNGASCNGKNITGLADPGGTDHAATKNYVDTSRDTFKTYVDSQDNNKLNKAGDTMSGVLVLNGGTVSTDTAVDSANRTNTYIRFNEAGSDSDWAYLRQIGTNENIHLSLDFHDNTNDGKFSLRSIASLGVASDAAPNTFFYSSPTGTIINSDLNMSNKKITNLSAPTTTTTNDAVPLSFLVNYVDLSNNQNIGGNKTFTSKVTFSGATKTNLDASDITNAVTMNTDQNIGGNKTFTNKVTFSGATKTNLDASDITNAVTMNTDQNIGGNKTFTNKVTFSGVTKTNLDASDITNAVTMNTDQNIAGNKTFTNTVALNNGASCNGKNITGLADPGGTNHAATKNYVDTQTANTNYLLRNGTSKMSGSLDMSLNKITNLPTPTTTTTNDAVPLSFLVNYVDLSNNQIIGGTKTFSNTVALNNGATCNSKNISGLADPGGPDHAATKNYVDNADNNKLNKAGDTMTGVLVLNGGTVSTDTAAVDSANRTNTYIRFNEAGSGNDWAYLRQIGTNENIHLSLDFHDNTNDGKFSLRSIASVGDNTSDAAPNTFFYSSPTGTTINSDLNMSNKKITNLSTPTTTTTNDAVPLSFLVNYVDLSNNQNIGGNKTFTSKVTFSGATKTNLDASDITNAVTMNTDQNITGTKTFTNTVALNNGASCNSKKLSNVLNPIDPQDAATKNYVDNADNNKVNKDGDTMSNVLTINKNASTFTQQNITRAIDFAFDNTGVKDVYYWTDDYSTPLYLTSNLFLPYIGMTITNVMVNRIVQFRFPIRTSYQPSVNLKAAGTYNINIDGVQYNASNPLNKNTSFALIGTETIGYYITTTFTDLSTITDFPQLTLKSNLGTTISKEFTGITFLNTNTTAGSIQVETDFKHTNSSMTFYTRNSDNMIIPLKIDNSGIVIGTTFNSVNPYLVNNTDICSIGYNQTWQNLTSSRPKNQWHQNTTGRPIQVMIAIVNNNNLNRSRFVLEVSTSQAASGIYISMGYTANDSNEFVLSGIIPSSGQVWYRVIENPSPAPNTVWSIDYWAELR